MEASRRNGRPWSASAAARATSSPAAAGSAGAADQVRLGDFTVLKDDLGGVAAAHTQLVFVLPHPQSRRLPLDDERGNPVPPLLRIGYRHHDLDAAAGTPRAEDFGPGG